MTKRTTVKFGTDGFRDYVTLPDGSTYNLGTVSVLNFVASLAESGGKARTALDKFLEDKKASLEVNLEDLVKLLAPKRARWAAEESEESEELSEIPRNRYSGIVSCIMDLEAGKRALTATSPNLAGYQTLEELCSGLKTASEKLLRVACGEEGPEEGCQECQSCSCSKTAAVDKSMLKELEIYLDNSTPLERQALELIKESKALIEEDKFKGAVATKVWLPWVEAGAKAYVKENGGEVSDIFPKELTKALAEEYSEYYGKAIKDGEYDHIKTASEEVEPILREIQATLEVLDQKPQTASTIAARKDLHRVASELLEVVGGQASVSGLRGLSLKVAHVRTYFKS